jgi:hypothetical protein
MAQADSNYTTKPSALIHDPHTNRTHESTTGDCGGLVQRIEEITHE